MRASSSTTSLGCLRGMIRSNWRTNFVTLVSAALVSVVSASNLRAADLEDTALTIVPQDAAFFSTSIGMEEQFEELLNGRFVARLRSVPYVQRLEEEFWRQWEDENSDMAQAKAWLKNPNVQNLLKLAREMFSEEFFVYGNQEWCSTINELMALQNDIVARANGGEEAMAEYFMSLEPDALEGVRIPTTILAFRIKDDENVRNQLDALEGVIRLGGSQIEEAQPFLKNLKRRDYRKGQSLTLTLDTSLIPWEETDIDPPLAEKFQALLEGHSISVGIGLKSNCLVLAIGEDTQVFENFGPQEEALLGHPDIAKLTEAKPDRLRSVSYVSAEFMQSQWEANFGSYFKNIVRQFSTVMDSEADKIPDMEQWKAELLEDADWLDSKLVGSSNQFGAVLNWTNGIEDGLEGYSYNFTKYGLLQNDAPIEVLEHAGENPLMVLGFKQEPNEQVAEMLEYVLRKYPRHVSQFIRLVEDDAEDREVALKVVDKSHPLVVDMYEIFRDKVFKAMDGEMVFAVSADWRLGELPNLPPPDEALPIPEIASAYALNDRKLFIEGCDELYQLMDRVVELIREFEPDYAPGYKVPRPAEMVESEITKYSYPDLTQQVPVEGFAPQAAVSDKVLVMSYSDSQVSEMLKARELANKPAWVGQDTPVAAVSYVNYAGFIRAMSPWIQYGFQTNGLAFDEPVSDGDGPIPTPTDILQIFDCFTSMGQAAGSTSVMESGGTESRWVWISE